MSPVNRKIVIPENARLYSGGLELAAAVITLGQAEVQHQVKGPAKSD